MIISANLVLCILCLYEIRPYMYSILNKFVRATWVPTTLPIRTNKPVRFTKQADIYY